MLRRVPRDAAWRAETGSTTSARPTQRRQPGTPSKGETERITPGDRLERPIRRIRDAIYGVITAAQYH